jgi:hypothetical protein
MLVNMKSFQMLSKITKNIITTLILLLLISSCLKSEIALLEPNEEEIYSIRYSKDWHVMNEGNYGKQYQQDALISLQHVKRPGGTIYIEAINREECSNQSQELKEGEENNEEIEEGPDIVAVFKKDSIKINNKIYDRWINERGIRFINIFVKTEGRKCILFSYVSNIGELEQKDLEDSFYKIIGTITKE